MEIEQRLKVCTLKITPSSMLSRPIKDLNKQISLKIGRVDWNTLRDECSFRQRPACKTKSERAFTVFF